MLICEVVSLDLYSIFITDAILIHKKKKTFYLNINKDYVHDLTQSYLV